MQSASSTASSTNREADKISAPVRTFTAFTEISSKHLLLSSGSSKSKLWSRMSIVLLILRFFRRHSRQSLTKLVNIYFLAAYIRYAADLGHIEACAQYI